MPAEKAILIGIEFQKDVIPIEDSLDELERLANTAGAIVVARMSQKRDKPDLKYFVGKGKMEDISFLLKEKGANLLIFDNEIHPSQSRNIEKDFGVKTIDRTELILDIFAQHAHTHEGRLQVKLAQLEFTMTHLSGKGILMSRLGGGIGTRGPGETKLEEDRRKIRKDIADLKKVLEELRKSRQVRSSERMSSGIKTVSIIGYTNAGKSTLLNSLTKAGVLTQDKLFATLDTTTRKLYLDSSNQILISDTVGFIQKLPHQLIDAFKATLEEVSRANILVHVVDASSPVLEQQINAVYATLEEINAIKAPVITVFNKIDLVDEETKKKLIAPLMKKYKPSVEISALKKTGLDELKKAVIESLN